MTEQFAFGIDNFAGIACPASSCGHDPETMRNVVRLYDMEIRKRKQETTGYVDEDEASEAWLKALEETTDTTHWIRSVEVAKELGWFDD